MTELFVRWQRGWGVARSLPPAEVVGGALRVRSMQLGRDVEYFAASLDDAGHLARLLLSEESVTWLTVAAMNPTAAGSAGNGAAATGRADAGAAGLEAAGLVILRRAEQLMTIDLRVHPRFNAPAPYRLQTFVESSPYGIVLTAEIRDESGERAASGTMGLSGSDGIADRVLTSPAHRRHGLGGAVMSALSRAALDQGASRGILLASEDGQRLYKALGWQPVANVLIATTPGNTYPG